MSNLYFLNLSQIKKRQSRNRGTAAFRFYLLIIHSAQRPASHFLRLTNPFKTLPPAYTQRRNSA